MEGLSPKKSASLEKLVIQNTENVNELKAKLNEIITAGKDYEYDVSACLKDLLKSNDQAIVLLTVQAISELAKCEHKRETFAEKEIIEPILKMMTETLAKVDLLKQCCRAIGNLCCNCNKTRKIVLEYNGFKSIHFILKVCMLDFKPQLADLMLLVTKTLLNYAIGGKEYTKSLINDDILDSAIQIFAMALDNKFGDYNIVTATLLILSVIMDNDPDLVFDSELNINVLNILRVAKNINVSELCVEHLHTQADHDEVKTLLAQEGGIHLVCQRIKELLEKHEAGQLTANDKAVETVLRQACDFIVTVLTGDEAMKTLYDEGVGEVYTTTIKWMDSKNYQLLATAVLAIGNFARRDDYCKQMMENNIYDKLLDIFEVYHGFSVRMQTNPEDVHPINKAMVVKIQHGALSALRNLTVTPVNKKIAADQGRAAPMFINALPNVEDHQVAYRLIAALRMLVDGQESVARLVAGSANALKAVARWGTAEHAGAAGEAPRLVAWTVRLLPADPALEHIVQAEGCVSNLVNMIVASHALMQNEAILALTLIAIYILKNTPEATEIETSYINQIVKSEIGKHVAVLIESNCAKMPLEVAENLIAFLDITSKNNTIVSDYKEAKVHESLKKFVEARKGFSDELKLRIENVITVISKE